MMTTEMADPQDMNQVLTVFRAARIEVEKDMASLDEVLDDMEENVATFRALPAHHRERLLASMKESTANTESIFLSFGKVVEEAEAMQSGVERRLERARRLMRRMTK